ncbi:vacuolar membrane protein-domain-containing protein [Scleroderma citrinum]
MSAIAHIIDSSLDDLPMDRKSCQLLGPTALVVQALMGVLAILSLVYKRHRETHKRPWRIWLFDVSKQVAGQMFIHGLNVLISDLGSHHFARNACTYYFLNILVDTTLGVGLIYFILQATTFVLSKELHLKGFESGQYGNPPSFTFWTRQAAVYVFALTAMKLLVIALFVVWPEIFKLGDWLLSWTRMSEGESFQVIFVMGIFPIIMNILQFWLIDSIVKANGTQFNSPSAAARVSDARDREPLFRSCDDGDDDIPPHDVEAASRPCGSRMSSGMDTMSHLLFTPSSPIVFSGSISATHDYPPNLGTPSSSASSKYRQRLKRSPPCSLDSGLGHVPSSPSNVPRHASPRRTTQNSSGSRTAENSIGQLATDSDLWEEARTRHAGSDIRRGRRLEHKQYLIGEK